MDHRQHQVAKLFIRQNYNSVTIEISHAQKAAPDDNYENRFDFICKRVANEIKTILIILNIPFLIIIITDCKLANSDCKLSGQKRFGEENEGGKRSLAQFSIRQKLEAGQPLSMSQRMFWPTWTRSNYQSNCIQRALTATQWVFASGLLLLLNKQNQRPKQTVSSLSNCNWDIWQQQVGIFAPRFYYNRSLNLFNQNFIVYRIRE